MPPDSSISVVICAYTLDRWSDLVASVRSVQAQTRAVQEVLLVIDHNDALLARVQAELPGVRVLASSGPPGLSGARNSGVGEAVGDIVVFLDDDARAEPGWLQNLVAPYSDELVAATGGSAQPAWDTPRPGWFPPEFDWVVGCSYQGLPTQAADVRNALGCNMSFRRSIVLEAGGFRTDIGRLGRLPVGCEETELSLRIRASSPSRRIVYVPAAAVRHRVPGTRSTWRYFRERCYQEGRSKALVAALAGMSAGLASERSYVARTLPSGVVRGVADALKGDASGLARSAAILAGLFITTMGYLAGRSGIDPIRATAAKSILLKPTK